MRFYRGNFTQIAIALQTNEMLGIFETDYIEDVSGNDGQLSIVSVATGINTPLVVGLESNESSGSLIRGRINLSSISNGFYLLQGRVKDTIGNLSPISQELEIRDGYETVPVINKLNKIPKTNYWKITRLPRNVATKRIRIPV